MPVQGQNQKSLCCLCCATGPITAEFRLERRGYVPGEAIRLFATIHNNSDCMMDKSFVSLVMVQTFHAPSSSKTWSKEVCRVSQGIRQGRSFSWEGQQFVVPPLPPSYLSGCKIIDIRYMLTLNVDPSGAALDLEVPLEILIGTVPLSHVVERFPPHAPPSLPPAPKAGYSAYPSPGTVHPPLLEGGASAPYPPPAEPLPPIMPVMPPSSIPNLPPPSYSESVFGRVNVKGKDDDEYTQGSLDFVPVYTYYDWGHQH